jgi:predicted 3-demethylubiquinone-9 3-methyltransferase (glyoxalase superfamily)
MSWQVSPENWQEMMKKPGSFEKMLTMKKIIIEDL